MKKILENLGCFFLVDKPKDMTSNQVIQKIKQNFSFIKKIGHGGTLDHFATGVLVVGINNHTKGLAKMINADKEYVATIQFNKKTTTYDLNGKITQETARKVLESDLLQIIAKYNNKFFYQYPPLYSAIKINGTRLYQYAQKNMQVNIKPRKVTIHELSLEAFNYEQQTAVLKMAVGKGFYVRSFANDIAIELHNFGHLIALRRTKVGPFDIKDCTTLEELGINLQETGDKNKDISLLN